MMPDDAARHLVSFAVNMLLAEEDGCCPKCCGPCYALVELREAGLLDEVAMPPTPGDAYDWFDVGAGKVRVELLEAAWVRGEGLVCHGLHDD